MTDPITFTDRYGGHPPDIATVCLGHCEGMGCYPVLRPSVYRDITDAEIMAWEAAHRTAHTLWTRVRCFFRYLPKFGLRSCLHSFREDAKCDGYHFIECVDCGGTGKRITLGPAS